MSESHSSFASKPWIAMAIANSTKSKDKIHKKFCKKKTHSKQKFMESSFQLIGTTLQCYSHIG